MKLYGYADGPDTTETPLAIGEVTLIAAPQILRDLAAFLVTVANEMERDTLGFDHAHAKDRIASLPSDGPDLIVASTRYAV
jgi:hypothetical protein